MDGGREGSQEGKVFQQNLKGRGRVYPEDGVVRRIGFPCKYRKAWKYSSMSPQGVLKQTPNPKQAGIYHSRGQAWAPIPTQD